MCVGDKAWGFIPHDVRKRCVRSCEVFFPFLESILPVMFCTNLYGLSRFVNSIISLAQIQFTRGVLLFVYLLCEFRVRSIDWHNSCCKQGFFLVSFNDIVPQFTKRTVGVFFVFLPFSKLCSVSWTLMVVKRVCSAWSEVLWTQLIIKTHPVDSNSTHRTMFIVSIVHHDDDFCARCSELNELKWMRSHACCESIHYFNI